MSLPLSLTVFRFAALNSGNLRFFLERKHILKVRKFPCLAPKPALKDFLHEDTQRAISIWIFTLARDYFRLVFFFSWVKKQPQTRSHKEYKILALRSHICSSNTAVALPFPTQGNETWCLADAKILFPSLLRICIYKQIWGGRESLTVWTETPHTHKLFWKKLLRHFNTSQTYLSED